MFLSKTANCSGIYEPHIFYVEQDMLNRKTKQKTTKIGFDIPRISAKRTDIILVLLLAEKLDKKKEKLTKSI